MDLSGVNYELAVDSGVAGIRHRKERQGLFSGLLFCPDCGNKLHFAACKNFDGKRRQKVEIFFNFVGRSPCWQNPCSQNLPLDAEKRRDLYIIDIIHIATGRLGPADGSAYDDAGSDSSKPAASTDAADELMKYRALLDRGVITEEEFNAKKAQLMEYL